MVTKHSSILSTIACFFGVVALSSNTMVFAGEICFFSGPLLGTQSKEKPNKCGPNTAMRYADRLGFNVAIDMWEFRWFDTTKLKNKKERFDVAYKACYPHDQCYRDIRYGRHRFGCTQAAFDDCNNAFFDNLEDRCRKLPKGCARNRCRKIMRDALYGVVKAAESKYKNDFC